MPASIRRRQYAITHDGACLSSYHYNRWRTHLCFYFNFLLKNSYQIKASLPTDVVYGKDIQKLGEALNNRKNNLVLANLQIFLYISLTFYHVWKRVNIFWINNPLILMHVGHFADMYALASSNNLCVQVCFHWQYILYVYYMLIYIQY